MPRVPASSSLVAAAVIAACTAAAHADSPEPIRVEIAVPNGPPRQVAGVIRVEAADGGLLLEHDDGRLEVIQPDTVVSRAPLDPVPPSETPRDLGSRILGELPTGFEFLITKHYIVCFDTSREYARWAASLFERLHDGFTNFWTRAGCDLTAPERPLVVVIFSDRRRYEEHAAGELGTAAERVVGYYNMLSNRVTTFDLTGSGGPPSGRRPDAPSSLDILARPESAGLVATLVHEATHQLAFNCGLHQRLAPVPLWVCEGVATFCETPDFSSDRGWRGIGKVNEPRRKQFLETAKAGWLEQLLRNDQAFRQANAATEAYAQAWALTAFLIQTKKSRFVEYLNLMAAKRPFEDDPEDGRIADFSAAFGPPDASMEQGVARFVARMR